MLFGRRGTFKLCKLRRARFKLNGAYKARNAEFDLLSLNKIESATTLPSRFHFDGRSEFNPGAFASRYITAKLMIMAITVPINDPMEAKEGSKDWTWTIPSENVL
jgi:hypothetical protein